MPTVKPSEFSDVIAPAKFEAPLAKYPVASPIINDVLKTAKSGFVLTTNALASILIWIIIFVVSVSPVLIIIGLIVIVVKVIMKRKKQ